MKNLIVAIAAVLLFSVPAFAKKPPKCKPAQVINNITEVTEVTNVTNVEDSHNAFDFGAYLDAIFLETPSTEWGIKTTYTAEGSETRVYAGGKVYFNRLLKRK